jgi:hypothetical protein
MLRDFALEHVGPGWELYSAKRFQAGGDPELHDPLGGIVVDVAHDHRVDPETGEIVDQARYRCLPWRRSDSWVILSADEVDLTKLVGVNRGACNAGAIRLLQPLFVGRKRAGLRGLDDVEAIHDAWRLAAAWAGIR